MNFKDLHELLRLELTGRVETGSLTRSRLAQLTGFQQAHISNFLNRKRSLSMEGMDRVLRALNLTVDQLVPASRAPVALSASVVEASSAGDDRVPLVSASAAMDDAIPAPASVIESIHVAASRLRDHRSRPSAQYAHWQRFVAIRADAQQAAAMHPIVCPGAVVVLDRHYNSLAPYRAHEHTLYAVRCGAGLALRYVEFDDGRLILRPRSVDFPVQLLALGAHETPADYLVGRVCMIVSEL